MPKCLNNSNKTYKGTENSPLGLGYCSFNEEIGTIKIGKNGKQWIVKQTKKSKRWSEIKSKNNRSSVIVDDSSDDELIKKMSNININSTLNVDHIIDFDNLDDTYFNEVFFPVISKLNYNKETGLENKFGGKYPFFIKGEEWPIDDEGCNMTFICQFNDPLLENNILYRVFVSQVNFDYLFSPIKLISENLKQQILIEDDESDLSLDCYIINNWEQKKELISFENILKKLNLEDNDEELNKKIYQKYVDNNYYPSFKIKIKGTPQFTQSPPIYANKLNFLQLLSCNFLKFQFGDLGIMHFNRNGYMHFDCF
jgi:uncharacterized protein YwqG